MASRIEKIADQRLGLWPEPIDLRELAAEEPTAPPMIIDDWLPAGYATLFSGHGGAGKSAIALHLSVCIATGANFFGLPVGQRRVLYLSCEDRVCVLHWRLARICAHEGIAMASLHDHLDLLDLVGYEAMLFGHDPMTEGELTTAYWELSDRVQRTGAEVIVVDGVADTFGGNENARAEVKRFINALVALIPPDRGAVIPVAHVNKPSASAGKTQEGYSGSTGWHNSARARWYLYPEQDDDGGTGNLRLELQKSNLGRSDQALRFRWDESAHLFIGERESQVSEFDRRAQEQSEREGIIAALHELIAGGDYCPAATQGQRTALHVLSSCKSFPESLQGASNRKRFWRLVEGLRRNGDIREGSIRRSNRHKVATLEPKLSADAGCVDVPNSSYQYSAQSDAPPPASNASNSTRGYGGARARTCPACDGEGCDWCEHSGVRP